MRLRAVVLLLVGASCRPAQWDPPLLADRDPRVDAGPRAAIVPPPPSFRDGVRVHLEKSDPSAAVVSFGLPLPRGAVEETSALSISRGGQSVQAKVRPLLHDYDGRGRRGALRSVLVQIPGDMLRGASLDLDISFRGTRRAWDDRVVSFASKGVSFESEEVVDTATRTIEPTAGGARLVEQGRARRVLYVAREPSVLATYPDGYLAATGILGELAPERQGAPDALAGARFFSRAFVDFARSAMYESAYAVSPEAVLDPVKEYEGWLYDRCATYLMAYAFGGEARVLRHALRACSFYAGKIRSVGPDAGIFAGKPEPDPKYSHARGLFAYYALTGDDAAFAAATAIARMWERDPHFVIPYRQGHLRGRDALWTERLLATSLEGLVYGYELTGDLTWLTASRELVATAHRHVTGNAAALQSINPGHAFPPQNCFIHSAKQHGEGEADEPWCSGWMSEMLVAPLLRYAEITEDEKPAAILVRLARFLRDVGSAYFTDDVRPDSFLAPSVCYEPGSERTRMLVPLYGAGLGPDHKRQSFGEASDVEHCADATALAAAGVWALHKTGGYDKGGPVGPFATEGESFLGLYEELAACAGRVFQQNTRRHRDPSEWTSGELESGVSEPARFIADNKIGWPVFHVSPARKLSWWFNQSMLQFELLGEAEVPVPALRPGRIQPRGCPR